MTFWTEQGANALEPKLKSRFLIKINEETWIAARSVTKPSVEISTKEFQMFNHFFNYPGVPKWSPITIKLVDSGDSSDASGATAEWLNTLLESAGYERPNAGGTTAIRKDKTRKAFGTTGLKIQQISTGKLQSGTVDKSTAKIIEEWTIINPVIKTIKWGDLDYSTDDLVEYTIDIVYDYAEFSTGPETPAGTPPSEAPATEE